MVPINYLAVLVSAVAAMVLGFLWYGPIFGKFWIKEMGWSEASIEEAKKKGMTMQYAVQAVGALVMAFVLAHFIILGVAYYPAVTPLKAGLHTALWNWLGFIVPVTVGVVLWEGKSWRLWSLNAGYYLVMLCVMGVILALWP